eukprot:TRINITY_DN47024_c0_g1_i1.p1 TRINITY_DN47024_c0_g1~~TRINITY_DN47024_c0_g1_i1.p1  ORF type:complete len:361 (+),score=22.35 TRINITY_DN47024_c0_g1_i1:56-1084(+)
MAGWVQQLPKGVRTLHLDVGYCRLSAAHIDCLANLSSLRVLSLDTTSTEVGVPGVIGLLSNLEELTLKFGFEEKNSQPDLIAEAEKLAQLSHSPNLRGLRIVLSGTLQTALAKHFAQLLWGPPHLARLEVSVCRATDLDDHIQLFQRPVGSTQLLKFCKVEWPTTAALNPQVLEAMSTTLTGVHKVSLPNTFTNFLAQDSWVPALSSMLSKLQCFRVNLDDHISPQGLSEMLQLAPNLSAVDITVQNYQQTVRDEYAHALEMLADATQLQTGVVQMKGTPPSVQAAQQLGAVLQSNCKSLKSFEFVCCGTKDNSTQLEEALQCSLGEKAVVHRLQHEMELPD